VPGPALVENRIVADPRAPNDPREIDFDLLELERADALLSGRDPAQADEVVRARVAAEEEKQRRQERMDALERERKRRRRRTQRKVALIAVVMAMAAGTGFMLSRSAGEEKRHREAVRKGLEIRSEGFAAHGFAVAGEWLDFPPNGQTLEIPADTCSVLVGSIEGSEADTAVKVVRKSGESSGPRGLLFCTCDAEQVSVQVEGVAGSRIGLRWLSVFAGKVGGFEVLKGRPLPPITIPDDRVGLMCSQRAFEDWIRGNQKEEFAPPPADPKSLMSIMVADGWQAVGTFPPDKPFAVVGVPKGQCMVAVVEGEASEIIARNTESVKVATSTQGIAACSHANERWYSLWRTKRPSSPVSVVRAPADRVGGLAGAQAMIHRVRRQPAAGIAHHEDLAADVVAALRGGTVPEANVVPAEASGLPGRVASRLVAMTLIDDGSYYPDLGASSPHSCRPAMAASESPRALLCAQSRAQRWNLEGTRGKQAAAESAPPFWLGVLADVDDKGAREAMLSVFAFAQRMNLLGFEPTTIEGVVDQANGARISWRAGKGEVVAIGLSRARPWVHPLSADGKTWSLEGPIPIAKVTESKPVLLLTRGSLGADRNARRVVAFRR